jgi:hypothetical protein
MRRLHDTAILPQSDLLDTADSSVQKHDFDAARRESEPESMLALCLTALLGWLVTGLLVLLVG